MYERKFMSMNNEKCKEVLKNRRVLARSSSQINTCIFSLYRIISVKVTANIFQHLCQHYIIDHP